jgi:hypothetical protein
MQNTKAQSPVALVVFMHDASTAQQPENFLPTLHDDYRDAVETHNSPA